MQISSILANRPETAAKSNLPQEKIGFSGIKTSVFYPDDYSKLIRGTKKGSIYPVIRRVATSIADGIDGCYKILTGNDAQLCRELEGQGVPDAFKKIVARAEKKILNKTA